MDVSNTVMQLVVIVVPAGVKVIVMSVAVQLARALVVITRVQADALTVAELAVKMAALVVVQIIAALTAA